MITSAGLVLAGTFAVLGTLPVVAFAEIGVAVALGVLLDTIIVRAVLGHRAEPRHRPAHVVAERDAATRTATDDALPDRRVGGQRLRASTDGEVPQPPVR